MKDINKLVADIRNAFLNGESDKLIKEMIIEFNKLEEEVYKELKVTTSNLTATLKALYVGKVFKGLPEQYIFLNNDATYQSILNHIISDAEITLSFKGCFYESDHPATVLTLCFNIPTKSNKPVKLTFDIDVDTPFTVEDPE
jgi:hypothetical protein